MLRFGMLLDVLSTRYSMQSETYSVKLYFGSVLGIMLLSLRIKLVLRPLAAVPSDDAYMNCFNHFNPIQQVDGRLMKMFKFNFLEMQGSRSVDFRKGF